MNIRVVRAVLIAPALLATLGGCVYRSVEKSTPSPVVMTPAPQPVVVPAPATAPAPPVRPATTAVVSQSDRTYTFTEGRWQLYGDGGATPYYWVWIPSGTTPPAPPMPPQAG